ILRRRRLSLRRRVLSSRQAVSEFGNDDDRNAGRREVEGSRFQLHEQSDDAEIGGTLSGHSKSRDEELGVKTRQTVYAARPSAPIEELGIGSEEFEDRRAGAYVAYSFRDRA